MKPSIAGITVLLSLLTGGCSTFDAPAPSDLSVPLSSNQQGKQLSSLSEIECAPMPLANGQTSFSAPVNKKTNTIELPGGVTPVVAYALPAGSLDIAISSLVLNGHHREKAEVFYPEIALLDSNNQIIQHISTGQVSYRKPNFLNPESIHSQFKLNNSASCMLIYTTDELRTGTTTLMNEAKEYARVRGVVPPPIPDIEARHGNNGSLRIRVKHSAEVAVAPVQHPTPTTDPVSDSMESAMQQHYMEGVRQALSEQDVRKALALRSELNELVQSTEGYFVSQYGKPADRIILPAPPLPEQGFMGKAQNHYRSEIARYLQSGHGSAALKLLDNLQHLQNQVNELFDIK